MLTNDQMVPGRFQKLYIGRKRFNAISECLKNGGRVVIPTYVRATIYTPRHAGMFRLGKSGSLYVQRGRNWDCIDFSLVVCQHADGSESVYRF
jgi:hypothetical protein